MPVCSTPLFLPDACFPTEFSFSIIEILASGFLISSNAIVDQ